MKILVAVPTFENITPDTFKSIYGLERGGHECIFEFVRGYDCATARNRIAQMSIDKGVDYVLMVDNDVVLPKDVLLNMLEDAKEVCLGYYAHRNADNVYTGRVSACKLKDERGDLYYNYPLESEYTAEEMKQLIESGEYKRKFDNATDNPNVNKSLYICAKNALKHRSGTELEDMYWLDSESGGVING